MSRSRHSALAKSVPTSTSPPWDSVQNTGAPQPWVAWEQPSGSQEDRLSRLVSALHRDIIPRLVQAHALPPVPQATDAPAPSPVTGVEAFTALLLNQDDVAIDACLAQWHAAGIDTERVLTEWLGPTARRLGELWEDDRCHFVDVTIGLGRLQQIMRRLTSAFGHDVGPPQSGRRVLLMPAPGEQHTFGLAMVGEFFTRAGWDVSGITGPEIADVQLRVKYEWFDLIGISAGTDARLEPLQRCIETVRRHSHNRDVALLVGGPLFIGRRDLARELGADGAATDGQSAPALAEQLLGRRVRARAA